MDLSPDTAPPRRQHAASQPFLLSLPTWFEEGPEGFAFPKHLPCLSELRMSPPSAPDFPCREACKQQLRDAWGQLGSHLTPPPQCSSGEQGEEGVASRLCKGAHQVTDSVPPPVLTPPAPASLDCHRFLLTTAPSVPRGERPRAWCWFFMVPAHTCVDTHVHTHTATDSGPGSTQGGL